MSGERTELHWPLLKPPIIVPTYREPLRTIYTPVYYPLHADPSMSNAERFTTEHRARTVITKASLSIDQQSYIQEHFKVKGRISRTKTETFFTCPTPDAARKLLAHIHGIHKDTFLSNELQDDHSLYYISNNDATLEDQASTLRSPTTSISLVRKPGKDSMIFVRHSTLNSLISMLNDHPQHNLLSEPRLANKTRMNLSAHRLMVLHTPPSSPADTSSNTSEIRAIVAKVATKPFHVHGINGKGCSFVLCEAPADTDKVLAESENGRYYGDQSFTFQRPDPLPNDVPVDTQLPTSSALIPTQRSYATAAARHPLIERMDTALRDAVAKLDTVIASHADDLEELRVYVESTVQDDGTKTREMLEEHNNRLTDEIKDLRALVEPMVSTITTLTMKVGAVAEALNNQQPKPTTRSNSTKSQVCTQVEFDSTYDPAQPATEYATPINPIALHLMITHSPGPPPMLPALSPPTSHVTSLTTLRRPSPPLPDPDPPNTTTSSSVCGLCSFEQCNEHQRSIVSQNILGDYRTKLPECISIMSHANIHVWAIQELWCKKEDAHKLDAICSPNPIVYTLSNKWKGRGSAIIFKAGWVLSFIDQITFHEGASHGVVVHTTDGTYWAIVNVYLPHQDDGDKTNHGTHIAAHMYPIINWVRALQYQPLRTVILGDFNHVMNPSIDRQYGTHWADTDHLFPMLIEETGWLDIFRELHPDLKQFSHPETAVTQASRIDIAFTTDSDWHYAQHQYHTHFVSDHAALQITTHDKNPSVCNILHNPIRKWDTTDLTRLKLLPRTTKISPTASPAVILHTLTIGSNNVLKLSSQPNLRDITNTPEIIALKRLLIPLMHEQRIIFSVERAEHVSALRAQIKQVRNSQLSKFCRERYAKAKAAPTTKELFRLCNWKRAYAPITTISPITCQLPTQDTFLQTIAGEFTKYFVELDVQQPPWTRPTPPPPIAATMFHPIDPPFVLKLLRGMHDSAPGRDGITRNLLLHTHPSMYIALANMINASLKGHIPTILKDMRIMPLVKNTPPTKYTDYRPIGLLSVLLKLITKTADMQLRDFLSQHKIISTEQQAFQPNCTTTNNGRIARNMIEDAQRNHHTLWILSLDGENAYGSMVHKTAVETLEDLGMPTDYITFISDLYKDFGATVITGRGDSTRLPIQAGVIQGDPLSCQTFILAGSEPMIRAAKATGKGYTSVTLPSAGRLAVLSYVDDNDLFESTNTDLTSVFCALNEPFTYRKFKWKPTKCKRILICPNNKREELLKEKFEINGLEIKIIDKNENAKCLGFPVSGNGKAYTMRKELSAAASISLGKLKAMSYLNHAHITLLVTAKVYSPILYRSPVNPYTKTWLQRIQKQVNSLFYRNLTLHSDIPLAALYLGCKWGGLGIPELTHMDDTKFLSHYVSALNSVNPLVKATTRDRLKNELLRIEFDKLSNHNTSDIHRTLQLIRRYGGTLAHKPNQDEDSMILVPLSSPTLSIPAPTARHLKKIRLTELSTIIDNHGHFLKYTAAVTKYPKLTKQHYTILKGSISTLPNEPSPEISKLIRNNRTFHKSSFLKRFNNILFDEAPIDVWGDGSFAPESTDTHETAGTALTLSQNGHMIADLVIRGIGQQTIQRAELAVPLIALTLIPPHLPVTFYLDSEYTIKTNTIWREKHNNNFMNYNNWDITRATSEQIQLRTAETTWTKVKSHTGIPENDYVDQRANEARNLPPNKNLPFHLIPPDTYYIIHNNTPILDVENWINMQHNQQLLDEVKQTSAWWYKIPNNSSLTTNHKYFRQYEDARDTFLFRARTGRLRTNKYLHTIANRNSTYSETDKCPLCNLETETIQHAMECDPTAFKALGEDLSELIQRITGVLIDVIVCWDEKITPLDPISPNPILTLGYLGALHSATKTIILALAGNIKGKSFIKKAIKQTTRTSHQVWNTRCNISHQPQY